MRGAVEGATVNDVVLTLIGGAVRRYFSAHRKAQGKDLYAICPVNLRADKTGVDSLAGNDISMMRTCLFTETRDPLERLRQIHGATQASKSVQAAPTARELVALSKDAPNLLLAVSSRVASNLAIGYMRKRPLSNMIITNVPGPQEPMYFMGARVVLSTGAGPVSPASGVIFPVTSYDGKLVISFTGCSGWITDPQSLAECLVESFVEMRQILPAAAARAAQRAKPKPPGKSKPTRRRHTRKAARKKA
jgi:WS/DGAT/MGAT family acyltransferase